MLGCVYNPPTSSSDAISSEDTTDSLVNSISTTTTTSQKETFLVRIYGNNTEVLIDRNEEIKNIILLHSYGFAPQLHAKFNNGIAYEFCPGEQITKQSIYDEKVWRQVAKRIAELHRDVKKSGQTDCEPFCWYKIRQMLLLIPDVFSNSQIQAK